MNKLNVTLTLLITSLLSSCSTTHTSHHPTSASTPKVQDSSAKPCPKKNQTCPRINPLAVQVYPKGIQLQHPYKVIAKGTVSKFNQAGNKRQDAMIHDDLRKLAASMGGNAIINVTRDKERVTGTVVAIDDKNVG